VTPEYLDLADYIGIASAVTGLDESMVAKVANLDLADSALHAPSAGFGGDDFYPDFVDKAAVLVVRLARNHPLPDGNKSVAWVSLRYFLVLNGWEWVVRPSIDEAEQAVLAIASGGWDETRVAQWIRPKIEPSAGERPDIP
jgi:death-on-curing protein